VHEAIDRVDSLASARSFRRFAFLVVCGKMPIGFLATHHPLGRRRDLKHFARWAGLVLGSILFIAIAVVDRDGLLGHSTRLTDGAAVVNASSLVVPLVTPSASSVQSTDQSKVSPPAQVDLAQAAGSARADDLLRVSRAPVNAYSTPASTQALGSIDPELHPLRSAPTKAAAPTVQTWPFDGFDLFIHIPPNATQNEPLQVLLALHGMGAQGDAFAQCLVTEADRNGWLLVAPTMPYGDYMNPTQLADDDVRLSQMLVATLDALPQRLGIKLQPKVLVYGFSRGAQLGHRFALFYPERVEAAAIFSAGSYTLPSEKGITDSGIQPLPLPYGVADLENRVNRPLDLEQFVKIPFFIAVGEKDTRAADVPRQFDSWVGTTRVQRAKTFQHVLQLLGMKALLMIAPNADHEVNAEMYKSGVEFLKENASKPPTQR
jgi:pimeloyl-ACP methyl ester carboxylesterase